MNGFELYLTSGTRRMYRSADGALTVEMSTCEGDTSKGGIMTKWAKCGYLARPLETFLGAQTYFKLGDGTQLTDVFNPTVNLERFEVDFDWMLEATEDNERLILDEIGRRYEAWKAAA